MYTLCTSTRICHVHVCTYTSTIQSRIFLQLVLISITFQLGFGAAHSECIYIHVCTTLCITKVHIERECASTFLSSSCHVQAEVGLSIYYVPLSHGSYEMSSTYCVTWHHITEAHGITEAHVVHIMHVHSENGHQNTIFEDEIES